MSATATTMPADLATAVRLLVLDVDGVLTDGGIFLGATDSGERIEMKRFEITDGLGVRLVQDAGVAVAIVTGRESLAVRLRADELRITECHQDAGAAKLPIVRDLIARLGIAWSEVAFMGDDLVDLPVLRRVGLPIAVANAVPEVMAEARWVTKRRGGDGAVRELVETLLRARGEWTERVEAYVAEREAG